MSIMFHCVLHGSQGMPGQKWPPLTGDCELASSLPDSEEGGKWQSRILPREQRWLDVRGWFLWTEIRFYWLSWGKLEIEISFPYECTSFWQGIVCRVVHLITLESIHSVAEELERRAIQVQLNWYSLYSGMNFGYPRWIIAILEKESWIMDLFSWLADRMSGLDIGSTNVHVI